MDNQLLKQLAINLMRLFLSLTHHLFLLYAFLMILFDLFHPITYQIYFKIYYSTSLYNP